MCESLSADEFDNLTLIEFLKKCIECPKNDSKFRLFPEECDLLETIRAMKMKDIPIEKL